MCGFAWQEGTTLPPTELYDLTIARLYMETTHSYIYTLSYSACTCSLMVQTASLVFACIYIRYQLIRCILTYSTLSCAYLVVTVFM